MTQSLPHGHEITGEPFDSGSLDVGDGHSVHFELHGSASGQPAVYLHGGPGGGLARSTASLFDTAQWKVLLFDQRGCGSSTPHACLEANTTWHLVEDMERLRERLEVESWLVCGGSWGSTLALAYAQKHPERVSALVLRGVFLCRRAELLWLYQEGVSWLAPQEWEEFVAPIPPAERGDMMAAYHKRLTGSDESAKLECAKAWSVWEASLLNLLPDPALREQFADPRYALSFARIESHYFANGAFLDSDDQLLANAGSLAGIPGVIVHGRHDEVTPLRSAWELSKAWPGSELVVVPDAGHAVSEPGIARALVEAVASFEA